MPPADGLFDPTRENGGLGAQNGAIDVISVEMRARLIQAFLDAALVNEI